ncbi:cell division protein FtsQ/DivIB [Haloflavibacter putidus]|uniref:Cell division protein FtsQ n=1 Tax=Haloflavibacter putidus TaxID=2576776 RepID=A0A507ZTL0_9FLAO|nr:cell division protein FtsQ/DivIB [Haloflavibacter putidus]TQD39853.1 hypothetical protein FKR84_05005 [Haloflavibacter putidus]
MKVNWNYIKAFALLAVLVFLYSFSAKRNSGRKVDKVAVQFTNGENLYIAETAVNKLLIVSKDSLEKQTKESLDLSVLEKRLDENKMIADADVYMNVDGSLGAIITQRQPIARIFDKNAFYIDSDGKKMPLSDNYSARVPLISGISEKNLEEVFPLVTQITKDNFLKKHIIAIQRLSSGDYKLSLRNLDFEVYLGKTTNFNKKIKNFKAFYKKAHQDQKLNAYKSVNLQFENQVVCTKK